VGDAGNRPGGCDKWPGRARYFFTPAVQFTNTVSGKFVSVSTVVFSRNRRQLADLESCAIKAIGGALSLQDVYDPPVFTPKTKQRQRRLKRSNTFLASARFRAEAILAEEKIWSVS